jgi:Protein of unknown function (DUF1552)
MSHVLSRRTMLLGALGAAVALPALEMFAPRKVQAAGAFPRRFLLGFGGISVQAQSPAQFITPSVATGPWANTLGLKAIREFGLEADAAFISNLLMPWQEDSRFNGQPARRHKNFHHGSIPPLITGMTKNLQWWLGNEDKTADSQMADILGGPRRQLAYRVQYDYYKGSISDARITCDGPGKPIVPEFSPAKAFQAFTTAFQATADEKKRREYQQAQGKSVLDLIKADRTRLSTRLGAADRVRMDQYYTSLRDIETKISGSVVGQCQPLNGFPKDDSAFGQTVRGINIQTGAYCADPDADGEEGNSTDLCRRVGYAFETERGELFGDLVALAFQCDLHRSVSFMVTYAQTFMSAVQMLEKDDPANKWKTSGIRTKDLHELGHSPSDPEMMAFFYAWHTRFLARLAKKLKETPDPDGVPILDRTAMVFVTEGGWGFDPSTGDQNTAHSTENMCALVLGGKALGLKLNQHLKTNQAHPCSVILSAMRRAADDDKINFGEVTQSVPGLV